jgi:hypothetical protein
MEAVLERLGFILFVVELAVSAWILLEVMAWMKRRAYNLTAAESVRSKNVKPDFLSVDSTKRQAAIERGQQAENTPAVRTQQLMSPSSRLTRWLALATAIASFALVALGVIMQIPKYQSIGQQLSSWGQFSAIIQRYPIGFTIAALVIMFHLINAFGHYSRRRGH